MSKRMGSSRNDSGMSLVEVLAAVVILSIVVSTSLAIFTQSRRTSLLDNERMQATHLAQYVLEQWTNDPANNYSNLVAKLKNTSRYQVNLNGQSPGAYWPNDSAYQGFAATITAAYVGGNNKNPIQVTVTATSRNQISISLNTLILPSTS